MTSWSNASARGHPKRTSPLFRSLLEAYGWTLGRESGNHVTFVKPGERSIGVPKVSGRRVKRVYLHKTCERLGLDE